MNRIKSSLHSIIAAFAVVALTASMTGCATDWPAVGAGAMTAYNDGVVVAQDVYTAINAVNQANNGSGKLDFNQVISYANAAKTSANSSGLLTALTAVYKDATATISQIKLKNPVATPTQLVNAVAAQNTTTAVTVAAITPNPSASLNFHRGHDGKLIWQLAFAPKPVSSQKS